MDRPDEVGRALEFIAHGYGDFDQIALAVFRRQFEAVAPYRRLCEARGIHPDGVSTWHQIPFVPTAAFKEHSMNGYDSCEREFLTSGTRIRRRGKHAFPSLDLYRASWPEPFSQYVLQGRRDLPILSLAADEAVAPESSLSFMISGAMEQFGAPGSGHFMSPQGGDWKSLNRCLRQLCDEDQPLLLAGTVFAFIHWLDSLAAQDVSFTLPEGTRIMDTGGFKGRSREMSREELLELYTRRLGVPDRQVVAEYGMTELSSQFYEAEPDVRRGVFTGPPWVKTMVLDPHTLAPVDSNLPGLLAHFDLANAWTVSAVLTEDLGAMERSGFRLLGRAPGSELRGCSLVVDELMGTE